jgi:diguanylate cyclase (GGDEF)-like protein/PAS domain S-box-containing protein
MDGEFFGIIWKSPMPSPAAKLIAEPTLEPTILSDGETLPYVLRLQQQIDEAFGGHISSVGGTPSAYLLRETLENINQGVMMCDGEHRVRIWNQRALELLDYPLDLIKQNPTIDDMIAFQMARSEFTKEELREIEAMRDADRERRPYLFERTRPNGRILKVQSIPLQMGGFVRTYSDVTDARAHQAEILAVEREYRHLYENATIGIYRSGVDGRIVWSNPALVELNGFESEADLINSVVSNGGEWYTDPKRHDEFRETVLRDGRLLEFESEVYLVKKNQRIWISENAWLVRDENGEPAYFEGTVLDITARKTSEARLEHLADHDALTDLVNRSAFERKLQAALEAKRPVAVIILDLDGFKLINDQYGHEAGDLVLKATARRIKTVWNKSMTAARFGGDEFAMLIDGGAQTANLGALASELVSAIGEPVKVGRRTVSVGVSIGIAQGPKDGATPAVLIRRADNALYVAKTGGKNTFRFFDASMVVEWQNNVELERDLRAAIRNNHLRLAYQPIVHVADGRLASREALIRWNDPQRGNVSPGEFVPFAERNGIIHQLDRYVLDRVCREAQLIPGDVPIAINISATEFASGDFYETVRAALLTSGLPGNRLEIEITESAILNDTANTAKTIAQLRALGIRMALDDFGAGYSALVNLKRYAFDKIKIDQYFLRNSGSNAVDIAILKAMIGLGNEIGVPVVVEGVETAEHHQLLKQLNCPLAQGYLFGRPEFLL